MALQIKRGTNAFRLTQTLLVGEPFFVTDAASLGITPFWIGDGTTVGGIATMNANNFSELLDVNVSAPATNNVLQYNADGTWHNSPNLTITGTTSLTGAVTAAGAVTVAGVLTSTGGITGGAATHTTGTFSGDVSAANVTASGDLAVNGGDITSTSSTANLFNNYNHSAINIGAASTGPINIGNSGNNTNVKGALIVDGNLTVSGTTTAVNSTVVNIKDEMIVLNYGETGSGVTPDSRRAGVQVARGSLASVSIQYNEKTDQWELTNNGTTFLPIATGSGFSSSTDIAAKSVTTTDYLKVSNTGSSTNYISQTTAEHTAKWTLDDTPDTYKLSLDNSDKLVVGTSSTTISNPLTINGNTTISGNLIASNLSGSALNVSGISTLSGTLKTGSNIILNNTVTGDPIDNATITVERGDSTDATLMWNEFYDRWDISNSLYVSNNIIVGGGLATNGNSITLNNDAGSFSDNNGYYAPVGLIVNRQADQYGAQSPAQLQWNETSKCWQLYTPNYLGVVTTNTIGAEPVFKNTTTDTLILRKAPNNALVYQADNTLNYTKFQLNSGQNSNITYTLPSSNSPATGALLSADSTGVMSWKQITANSGITYDASTGVISHNLNLNGLTDVTVTSPAAGQLLSYNGTDWSNSNVITSTASGNRLNVQYNNSTAGINNALILRKNFGATNFANDDGTGIRFEVQSDSQGQVEYAVITTSYNTTAPSINMATSIDDGATYTDVANFSTSQAKFSGSVRLMGNKIYDSANGVAVDFQTNTVNGGTIYLAKFNGSKNYGLAANFINIDDIVEHNTSSLTTTSTNVAVLDSWSLTSWRSAKYLIQISNGTNHQMWEGMAIHDGTNIKITAYGDLRTGSNNLATVSAGINSVTGKAELRVTPVNATTTKFKATKTLIAV